MKTAEEFVESLRRQKPKVYMFGQRIEGAVSEHPALKASLNSAALPYALALDSKYKELILRRSPFIGQDVNAALQMEKSMQEGFNKQQFIRMTIPLSTCTFRCMAANTLAPLFFVTYECDEQYHTEYHQRFIEYLKKVQKDDLNLAGAMSDAKGDRSLPPHQQADPDMHVRVVEKKKDGIIVRGAKAHCSNAVLSNEIMVMPGGAYREEDKNCVVAFAIQLETEGVVFLTRPGGGPRKRKGFDSPLSSKYGTPLESLVVFEDVFVPWERVFLCGEWEMSGRLIQLNTALERSALCPCLAAKIERKAAAAALIAEYNGVEKARHIQAKIADMIVSAEILNSLGVAAFVQGRMHPTGYWVPDPLPGQAGKIFGGYQLGIANMLCLDIAGGLTITMPLMDDYENPETRGYFEKYFKGKAGIPAENRLRAFKLVEDIASSTLSDYELNEYISGGGSPEASRLLLMRFYDMEAQKRNVKTLCGITES